MSISLGLLHLYLNSALMPAIILMNKIKCSVVVQSQICIMDHDESRQELNKCHWTLEVLWTDPICAYR